MKLFFASLRLELKRSFLSRWFFIFLLIIALVFSLLAVGYHSQRQVFELRAGMVFSSEDSFAQAVFQRLTQLEGATFERLEGVEDDELQALVATGQYAVIYFLPENLEEAFTKGAIQDAVTSYVSPGNTLASLLDEWLFSAVLVESAPSISMAEIKRHFGDTDPSLREEIEKRFQHFEENESYVTTETFWQGVKDSSQPTPTENPRLGWVRVYHGVLSLVLLLVAAANLSSLIPRLAHVDVGLRRPQRMVFRLASYVAFFISSFVFGLVSLGLLRSLDAAILRPFWAEVLALAGYLLFLGALILLLSSLLPDTDSLFSGTLFTLLAFMFLGGTLYTPTEISGWLDQIAHLFPSYYYTQSLVLATPAPLSFLVIGAALLLIATAIVVLLTPQPKNI